MRRRGEKWNSRWGKNRYHGRQTTFLDYLNKHDSIFSVDVHTDVNPTLEYYLFTLRWSPSSP